MDNITCFVELLHSIPKYKTNKVVLATTTIHGRKFWDEDNTSYVVFNNPIYTDNLSIRITFTSPSRNFTIEESIGNVNTASELNINAYSTGVSPLYPDEIITGCLDSNLKPLLDLDFLANFPVKRGTDFSYSGGGDRFLPKNNTWVKQKVNTLEPSIVELADSATNNLNIRLVPLQNGIPQGWTINATANRQMFGYITQKYSFTNSWKCKIFNYDGMVNIISPIRPVEDRTKGYLFGGYFTLNPDNGSLDTFTVSLIFRDASSSVVGGIGETIDATLLEGITPIEAFVIADRDNIPLTTSSVCGQITFGRITFDNNVALTLELPQLINHNIITYPVYKHRRADTMVVSNRNIHTAKGAVICEFIATHNKKNFYFDTRRNNIDGLAGYFNGGKLGLIINNGGTDYEIQAPWKQEWYQSVISLVNDELPTDAEVGNRYLIISYNPKLRAHRNQIATYEGSSTWSYETPITGAAIWIESDVKAYVFEGTRWISYNVAEEGRSSVAFVWDQVGSIRKIYGNGILLTTDITTFTTPLKTYRVVIGSKVDGTFHINTKIIRFLIAGDTNVSIDDHY